MSSLTVHEMPVEDCWKDIARIPKDYRIDLNGKVIRRAKICKLTINKKQKLLLVFGCRGNERKILLDSPTRGYFGVEAGQAYEVELRPVWWCDYWRWAWDASDPKYRIPIQISLISLLLGIIALTLGFMLS